MQHTRKPRPLFLALLPIPAPPPLCMPLSCVPPALAFSDVDVAAAMLSPLRKAKCTCSTRGEGGAFTHNNKVLSLRRKLLSLSSLQKTGGVTFRGIWNGNYGICQCYVHALYRMNMKFRKLLCIGLYVEFPIESIFELSPQRRVSDTREHDRGIIRFFSSFKAETWISLCGWMSYGIFGRGRFEQQGHFLCSNNAVHSRGKWIRAAKEQCHNNRNCIQIALCDDLCLMPTNAAKVGPMFSPIRTPRKLRNQERSDRFWSSKTGNFI